MGSYDGGQHDSNCRGDKGGLKKRRNFHQGLIPPMCSGADPGLDDGEMAAWPILSLIIRAK
jgi:hypothetical protein